MVEHLHGDGWKILPQLTAQGRRFRAVVTDPPYSSGGLFRGDRNADPLDKYCIGTKDVKRDYLSFRGDNMDQRAWFRFSVEWMRDALALTEPGGVMLAFVDWRQLPTMADALQIAGWTWRGVIPWNKTAAVRPSRGYYRGQCEFILHGTNGSMGKDQDRVSEHYAEGFFTRPVRGVDKHHPAGKPVELMHDLLEILPPETSVLDPFAGSASTGVACELLKLPATLVEREDHWHAWGSIRTKAAREGKRLTFEQVQALLPGISPDEADELQPELFPRDA